MPALEDAHKEFLQAIMSHGIMPGRMIKEVINDIMRRHGIQSDFASYMTAVVAAINSTLEQYDMQIKKCICEVAGTNYYALVNQTEHPLNKLSPYYTPAQLELYKKVVEEVVTSETGTVSSLQVLNFEFGDQVKFSRKEREETVAKMVHDKWLLDLDGEISLSARSINELEIYIKEVHKDDAVICPACNVLIIRGQRCAKDDCTVRVHKHCAKKIFKAGTQRKCPTCKTPWNVSAEDEASATQNSSTQNVSSTQNASADSMQQQQPSTSSGRRGRSTSGRS